MSVSVVSKVIYQISAKRPVSRKLKYLWNVNDHQLIMVA